MELEGFVRPGVFSIPASEKFWYFLAADETKTPMGMAVTAPYKDEAELLSIGVSENYMRKGVATELFVRCNGVSTATLLSAFVLNSKTFIAFMCDRSLFLCQRRCKSGKKDFTITHFLNIVHNATLNTLQLVKI